MEDGNCVAPEVLTVGVQGLEQCNTEAREQGLRDLLNQ